MPLPQNPLKSSNAQNAQSETLDLTPDEWEAHVASRLGVPEGLYKSLTGQESGGKQFRADGRVVSSPPNNTRGARGQSARGRYQLLPSTAQKYGMNPDDEYDNIYAGLRYLREKFDEVRPSVKSDNDGWMAALAGYHGGERQIKHIQRTGQIAEGADVNMTTADYVDRIMKGWEKRAKQQGVQLVEQVSPGLPQQAAPAQSSPVKPVRPQTQQTQAAGARPSPVSALPANSPFDFRGANANATLANIQNSDWQRKLNAPSTPEQERAANQRNQRIQQGRERFKNRSPIGRAVEAITTKALGNAEPYLTPEARAALNEQRVALGMDNPTYEGGLTHYANTAKKSAVQQLATYPEGLAELVDSKYNYPQRAMDYVADKIGLPGSKKIAPSIRPITDAANAGAEMVWPTDARRSGETGTGVASGVGSLGAQVATSAFGPALQGLSYSATGAQQNVREADRMGVAPEKRDDVILFGALTGQTERLGMGRWLDKLGLRQSFMQRAYQVLEEGGQEALQQWMNNVSAKWVGAYDPQREQTGGMKQAAIMGFLVGLIGQSAQGVSTVAPKAIEGLDAMQAKRTANQQAAAVRAEVPRPLNLAPTKRFDQTQVIKLPQAQRPVKGGKAGAVNEPAASVQAGNAELDPAMQALLASEPQAGADAAQVAQAAGGAKAGKAAVAGAVEPLRVFAPDETPDAPAANRFQDTIEVDGQDYFFDAPKNLSKEAARKLALREVRKTVPPPPPVAPPVPAAKPRALSPELGTGKLEQRAANTGIFPAPLNTQELTQAEARRLGVKPNGLLEGVRDLMSNQPDAPPTAKLKNQSLTDAVERKREQMRNEATETALNAGERRAQLVSQAEPDYRRALQELAAEDEALKVKLQYAESIVERAEIRKAREGLRQTKLEYTKAARTQKPDSNPFRDFRPVPLLDSQVNTGGVPATELPRDNRSIRFEDLAEQQKRSGTGGLRLLQRIRQLGGINPAGSTGELVNAIERKQPGLINRKDGVKPDRLLELLAIDEGYPVDRQDLNTLWKAIDDDASGKPVYPVTKSRTAEIADEEAAFYEARAQSEDLRQQEAAANAPTGNVSAPMGERPASNRLPSGRLPSQALPQVEAEPMATDDVNDVGDGPGLTVDEVLAQPEPERRAGTTPFDGIKMRFSPGGRGFRLRLPYRNTGFLRAAKDNLLGRYYEDKDRRGGEWFVDPKNADEVKRLAAYHFKQPVAVQGDTANFEPVPGDIPRAEESQYTQMARDKADAINELYQLEDVNSERGEALQNEIREYLAYEGFARKHYGALMAAIKSFHSDRAREKNDIERYQQRQTTPEPPPSAPPAAAVAAQPVEDPQAVQPVEQLTREGNSEPLYREPTAALRPPSRMLSETQLPQSAGVRYLNMPMGDLRNEIERLTELRNDDIRRGHLSLDERAQVLGDLADAQETYSNRRSDLSKRVTKARDVIKADDEARAVMAEKAKNLKSRKQDREVLSDAQRRLAEERLRRAQAELDAVPTLVEAPSAPSAETVAARRQRNIDAAQGRERLAVPVSERDSSAALPSGFLRAVEKPTERLVVHGNPAIDGKPVLAETADGRVIVANPENASGISMVKDQVDESGKTGYTGELKEIETANLPVTEAVAQNELNATSQRNQNSQANVAGTQTTGKLGGQSARLDSQSRDARRGSQNLSPNQSSLSDGVGTEKAGDQPGQVSTQSQKLNKPPITRMREQVESYHEAFAESRTSSDAQAVLERGRKLVSEINEALKIAKTAEERAAWNSLADRIRSFDASYIERFNEMLSEERQADSKARDASEKDQMVAEDEADFPDTEEPGVSHYIYARNKAGKKVQVGGPYKSAAEARRNRSEVFDNLPPAIARDFAGFRYGKRVDVQQDSAGETRPRAVTDFSVPNFSRLDEMARAGYLYAQGDKRALPLFKTDIDIDAFNAGINNFNIKNNANVPHPPVFTTKLNDGTNTGQSSDKELAIVGAGASSWVNMRTDAQGGADAIPAEPSNSPQINKANSPNELPQNEAADSDLPANMPQLSPDAEFVLRIIKTDGKGEVRRLGLNKMTDLVNSKLNPALKELQDAGLITNESGTIRASDKNKKGDDGVVQLASGVPLAPLFHSVFSRVPAKFDAKTLRREVVAKLKEIKATPAIEAKAVALVAQMTQAAEQNRATAGDRTGLKSLNVDPYGQQFHEARGELLKLLAGGNKAKMFRPGMRKRFFETLGSAQTGAQLGTPKFVGMNIIQHFVFAGQEKLVNTVASVLDAGASRLTGKQRVIAKPQSSYFKDYLAGMKLARDMRRKGQRMPGMNPPEQLAASTRLGEAFERLLFWINEVPDSGNYVAHFKRAYDSAVKVAALNGQTLTPEMIDEAKAEANRAALRDENFVSNAATMVKDSLNALSSPVTGTRSFGLGDFVLKYTRTPGALVKRAIEYSPLGLFEAAHYAKDGVRGDQKAQRNAILAFSRATVGTAQTIGAGAALAALGLLASPPDDEDYNLKTETARAGRRGYQLNLSALLRLPDLLTAYAHGQRHDNKPLPGDYLINIDKVQPWAMGASVGAKLFERWQRGELVSGGTLASAGQAASQSIATLLDVMGDQSLLKNVEKYIAQWRGASTEEKAASVARAIAVDVPSSFVPGLLREARNLADDKVRDTRPERREGLGGMFEESLNKVRAQIPSQSSKLPERNSLLTGEPARTTQGQRGWAAKIGGALLPEFPSRYEPSPVLEEINRLNAILPDSERVNLTLPRLSGEATSDLRVREAGFGDLNNAQLERLINSIGYRAATDQRRAKMIEDVFKKNRSLVKPRPRPLGAQ